MYERTYQRLRSMGFQELEEHRIDGLAWFRDGIVDILLQQWDETMSKETVFNECQQAREMLSKRGGNPWNAYYLLCAGDNELNDEEVYLIEHNALIMRKYVVRCEYDLNRVPFLDETRSLAPGTRETRDTTVIVPNIVQRFVNYLAANEGIYVRFSKDEVKVAIQKVMSISGGETE